MAAVPDEFCDEMSLVGPVERIRERYRAWADSGITGLTIVTEQAEAMELMASLAGSSERFGLLSLWRDTASRRRPERCWPSACWSPAASHRDEVAARARVPRSPRSEARRAASSTWAAAPAWSPAMPSRRVTPGGRAVGLDSSAEFLALARSLAREAGLDKSSSFVRAMPSRFPSTTVSSTRPSR